MGTQIGDRKGLLLLYIISCVNQLIVFMSGGGKHLDWSTESWERMIDRATVTMRELFGEGERERRGAGLSDIWGFLVLPHSRTPLWSYTPRCICSWFSEGRGMGQRVILLKNHTSHPQREIEREWETGRDGQTRRETDPTERREDEEGGSDRSETIRRDWEKEEADRRR